ncbi:MAG TPA: hypothetical protein QGH84_06755 [Rhodospirillales bacterium]|jgi:hypothetical protein|nr:hypothetical protein [Rhodospirillales bacterium]
MVKKPSQQKADEDGGAEFFAPVTSGYKQTDEAPAAMTPPPSAEPPPAAPPTPVQPAAAPPPVQPQPAKPQPAKPEPAKAPAPIDMSTPKGASDALATTMVQGFVEQMKAAAKAKGGHLTVQDMEDMQAEFDRQTQALSGALERSFGAYMKAQERSNFDQQRNFPFDRLMVKKFSNLFKDGDHLGPDDLCRRMLPGFFVGLGMMLGPDVIEEYQEKLRAVVARVKDDGKGVFNWELVYKDKTAIGIALNAEVEIAQHFDEYDKRAEWFINMINGHLTAIDADVHPKVRDWEISATGFKGFMRGMLSDLRAQLDSDAGKMAITKKYGAETCADLFDIFANFE